MGQEFHVLRCFSCQVFQVQQVKKSKRWVCKVCGEKQSLLKEFGRGCAADCRRHVQKLNGLRGRLQEVSRDTPGSQWEQDDKSENEDVDEGLDRDPMDRSEQKVSHHVSRWSKYTDPTAEGPDEDEEEEQNISTERQRFRSQGSRKRKKISDLKSLAGTHDVCEDEEASTGCSGLKRPYLPMQQDRRFGSAWNKGSASCGRSDDVDSCRSTNLPSSRLAVRSYPPACSSTYTAENPGNKPQHVDKSPFVPFGETSDSKWNKFLPVVPSQRDEDEYDYQAFSQCNDKSGVDCEERRYPPDEKTRGGVCADGSLSSTTNTHTSKPSGFEHTVSEHPPLTKMPRSKLSFNPMFLTDEDFDDTF